MSDQESSNPIGDLLHAMQELTSQLTDAAFKAANVGARAVPEFLAAPLAQYVEATAKLNDLLTGPLRRLLDEQQSLAERLAHWAQQHKELSEQIANWAEQHQHLTDQMQQVVRPALDQAERMAEASKTFAENLRT